MNIAEYSNGEEIKDRDDITDLLFLDINLQGINGIQVKNIIEKKENFNYLVFVSAYKHYVWEAFGKKTLGFIQKPFKYEDIEEMIDKYFKTMNNDIIINIHIDDYDLPVKISSVPYIKARNYYSEVIVNDKIYLIRETLNEWEKKLRDYDFIRIHKSNLVNLAYIRTINGTTVILDNEVQLKVGRSKIPEIKKKFYEYCKKNAK